MTTEQRRPPRDDEEAAAFKGMGHAVTIIRERKGMDRDELASRCDTTRAELEKVERGDLDETWGGLRVLAKALEMSLPALVVQAEECESGRGSEHRRQEREAEPGSAVPGPESDAGAMGGRRGRRGS